DEAGGVELGDDLERFARREHARGHAVVVLQLDVLLEARGLGLVFGEKQIAALAQPDVDAELLGESLADGERLLHELDVPSRRPLLADAAAVAPRRAAREISALDDHDVAHVAHGQVVRDRKTDHAPADDGDVAGRLHFFSSSPRAKYFIAVGTMG